MHLHRSLCFACFADVSIADRWHGTPLMAALRNGHLAIARMLMSCEARLPDNADPDLVQVSRLSADPLHLNSITTRAHQWHYCKCSKVSVCNGGASGCQALYQA